LRIDAGTASGEHLQVEELPCEQRESGQLSSAEQQASARELPIGVKMKFVGFRHRSVNSWKGMQSSVTVRGSDGLTLRGRRCVREPLDPVDVAFR
jgi:hypothetical protein